MTYFRMALCPGENVVDLVRGEFDTVADGTAWVEEHHPGFMEAAKELWESPDRGPDGPKQFGTDYHWVVFEPLAGERP